MTDNPPAHRGQPPTEAELRTKYGDLMTAREIAAEANIKVETFRFYVRDGYAPRPSRRAGNVGMYSIETAASWLADRTAHRRTNPQMYVTVRRIVPASA